MKDYFLKLLAYDTWANTRIVSQLINDKIEEEEIIKLASHIQNAKYIWFSRASGLKLYDCSVWDIYKVEELLSKDQESTRLWSDFISRASENDFERIITYTNSQGKEYSTSLSDIFIHVMNHGTYHRSQIAKLLRQKNYNPVNTDYITYTRK